MKIKISKKKGFTLIELLIVVAIIAILAAAVIITITPGQRLTDTRNATRRSHMAAIGTAAHTEVVINEDFVSIYNLLDDASGCNFATATDWNDLTDACAVIMGLGSAPVDPQNSDWSYQVQATATTAASRLNIRPTTTATEWDGGTLTF
jgi:prepilin-type N-terminal cleavage/methylation domain-containing protein